MEIQSLGLLSSIAARGNINTIADKGNCPSFLQILSEIRETKPITAKDIYNKI